MDQFSPKKNLPTKSALPICFKKDHRCLPLVGFSLYALGYSWRGNSSCISVLFAINATSSDTTALEVRPTTTPVGQIIGFPLQ